MQTVIEQMSRGGDRRTPEEFRAAVEKWQDECQAMIEDVVTEFLRHTLARGRFGIRNESDRYLENVRVRVSFSPGVTVLMVSDTAYCEHGGPFQVFQMLPDRPPKYGEVGLYDFLGVLPKIKPAGPSLPASALRVDQNAEGCVVSWFVGDLPPRGAVTADELFAVFTDENLHEHHAQATASKDHKPMPTEVSATWQVTARAVDYVFQGEFVLACNQKAGDVAMWQRR